MNYYTTHHLSTLDDEYQPVARRYSDGGSTRTYVASCGAKAHVYNGHWREIGIQTPDSVDCAACRESWEFIEYCIENPGLSVRTYEVRATPVHYSDRTGLWDFVLNVVKT